MTVLERTVDLRCPNVPGRLLAKVRQAQDHSAIVDGNLLELACRDCRSIIAGQEGKKPTLVLHRFNVLGALIESEIIWPEGN